jgi:hypothetical protein
MSENPPRVITAGILCYLGNDESVKGCRAPRASRSEPEIRLTHTVIAEKLAAGAGHDDTAVF